MQTMQKDWTAEQILDVVRGFQPACAITAAVELGVFTALYAKPITPLSLAGKLNCNTRGISILLDALVALGLLTKQNNLYCICPELGEILSDTGTGSIISAVRHQGNCLRRWSQLANVIQTGKPAERLPSIRGEAADLASFIGAMDVFSAPVAPSVIEQLGPLSFNHLLDVAGASGTWTITLLNAVPDAKATLFDLPEVIPFARQRIQKAGLSHRVKFVAGNFYKDKLPKGADFALFSAIAHQNSRQQNRELFAQIYSALSENSVLVIRDVVMDESRTQPLAGALFALNMLVGTGNGGTYTFSEFRDDLMQANFTKIKLIYHDQAMNSLIRAEKL